MSENMSNEKIMIENSENQNISVDSKKTKVLYIIQGIMMIVSVVSSFVTLSNMNEESDLFIPSLFSVIVGVIFSVILMIGFFKVKDKLIGKIWIVSAIVGFVFDFIGVLSGANAFLLLSGAILMIFKIALAKGFLTEDEAKLKKIIVLVPALLGAYVLLSSIYTGILQADNYNYYFDYYYSLSSPSKTELFFKGFGSGLLSNLFGNLIAFVAAYLILVSKGGKIKINKIEKRKPVAAPQHREISVAEKADILKEYKTMLDEGIITAEEYEEKKNLILNGNQ